VGKLEVAETSGLNQGLLNIVKNNLLITENTEYAIDHHWGIKLPTTWVADFDVKGHSGKYVEFNFYNEGFTSNTSGYTLNFKDTSLTLKYDNGGTTLASATIPTIVNTYRKVNIFFERNVIAVSIDGTQVLYDKRPSVLSRVISTTGSAFVNVFIESDNENNSKFKNLRIVNGRFISDQTSNIAFMGGNLGVGVNSPTESLDVLGSIKSSANLHVSGNVHAGGEIELYSNLNIQQVSNTATIKATSNVVAEFPRSKKLIKYPRVALTSAAETESGYEGYIVTRSSQYSDYNAWEAFHENNPAGTGQEGAGAGWASTIPGTYSVSTGAETGSVEHHTGSVQGEWIQIQLPESIYLHDFVIASRTETTYNTSGFDHGFPEKVVLYGSNDGSSWVSIKTFTTVDKNHSKVHTENINETTQTYKYFALVVNSTHVLQNTTQTSHVSIGQIRLYGVPEYDPDAHGTDVTIKSYPNVPNTDWLEVYYDAKDYSGTPSSITDKSGNNITATANNITIDATYNSFEFTQSPKSNIIAENVTFVSGDESHSIVLWVRLKNGNANNLLFDYRVAGGTATTGAATGLYILNSNKRLQFFHQSADKVIDLDFEQNRWYHIVGTYAGGGGFTGSKIYIDGVDVGGVISGSDSPLVLPTTGTITIGDYLYGGIGLGDGSIANFRLFNRALTSDEIYQLYAYQKKDFGHGDLSMTLKAGRLGIGTSEPRAMLDIQGPVRIYDTVLTNPVYAFFSTNYASSTLSDAVGDDHWRRVNYIDYNLSRQSDHNAMDTTSARDVRGRFTVPVDGVYAISFAALVVRFENSASIYIFLNGAALSDLAQPRSHMNRNAEGSFWDTLIIDGVLRLKRGDIVQAYISGTASWYTLSAYTHGSIYQIGP
jgi:hypothetical protein